MKNTPKDVLDRIKERNVLESKANYTFSIRKALMTKFRTRCKKEGVSMASVIEEFIAGFVET